MPSGTYTLSYGVLPPHPETYRKLGSQPFNLLLPPGLPPNRSEPPLILITKTTNKETRGERRLPLTAFAWWATTKRNEMTVNDCRKVGYTMGS